MAAKSKTPRLGRGLSALMAQPVKIPPAQENDKSAKASKPAEADKTTEAGKTDRSTRTSSNTARTEARGKNASTLQPAQPEQDAGPATEDANAAAASKAKQVQPGKDDASSSADAKGDTDTAQASAADPQAGGGLVWLKVDAIRPNRHQPRRHFDEKAIQQLAASITSDGLMQPVIVRPARQATAGITHELVAGERRWRAAKLAGLAAVPAIVRELDDHQAASWALVENLQREDLNPMERAEAFHNLVNQFKLSHEQIAQRVGVDRSTVSNLLRFMELDSQVQAWLRTGQLSAGQARALAGLSDLEAQRALAQKAIAQAMSVRQVESAVRAFNDAGQPASQDKTIKKQARAAHFADLEEFLGKQLETKVHIRPGKRKGSGTLSIDFYSVDQFDAILQRLDVKTE